MAIVKVHGVKRNILINRDKMSQIIHECMVIKLGLPADKRYHFFHAIDRESVYYPSDRTDRYTLIEITLFEGRPQDKIKEVIHLILERICDDLDLPKDDVEVIVYPVPKNSWGLKGLVAQDLPLGYQEND
ncbi:MAG: tautomerase family protein [Bacteroidota bacterium]|nr:tautomerase family protein [Bacteroidota bacterium]